jgi:hypothetical protein
MSFRRYFFAAGSTILAIALLATPIRAQQDAKQPAGDKAQAAAAAPKKSQAELEADFAKMLSGATLEGSFNSTGAGRDSTKLSVDKYTLGEVKKQFGNIWTIQYKFRDQVVPLPIPIVWAGDTPVITIDNFSFAGMGPYSARVMFFADHYSGYWKHGERGGLMFGVVHRAQPAEGAATDLNPTVQRKSSTPTEPAKN